MITKFKRKNSGGLEAIQYTGDNGQEIVDWIGPDAMLLGDQLTVPGKAGQMITVKSGWWVVKKQSGDVGAMPDHQLRWAYEEA